MKKVAILLLGLLLVLYVAKEYLAKNPLSPPAESSQAKQRLDNVRTKARAFEEAGDKRAEDAAKEPAEK